MNNNKLEDLREELNLKSKDIADILDVARSTYSEWEHNKIPIPTKRMIEIADYYQINIDYMLQLNNKRRIINRKTNINLEQIGFRLKEIRKSLNYTLRELGEILNCSYSSLACYERGEHLINTNTLLSFAYITGYSIDYILGRSNIQHIK